jgi:hypothetical protein
MDYVYICRSGDNDELRYSLRSIEENMPEGRVWVVGYRPNWYIGDFLPVSDIGGKFDNITNCIKVVSENKDISENFILMNDDFFALKKINEVPIFHGGLLKDKIERYKEQRMASKYIRLLELTYNQLLANNVKDPIDYDIHVPMKINKEKLRQTISVAYFPRSSYGNMAAIGGAKIKDVKMYGSAKIDQKNNFDFISTEDGSFVSLRDSFLKQKFSKTGKLENPNY